jgi:hypothetical protein
MKNMKGILNSGLGMLVIGLVIGLLIGLPVLGWWLWPVQWKDADASHLRTDLKEQYLCMTIDSYSVNRNVDLALFRLDSLGINSSAAPQVLDSLKKGACSYAASDPVVVALKAAILQKPSTQGTAIAPSPTQSNSGTSGKNGLITLILLLVVFVALGGGLGYIFLVRNRRRLADVPENEAEEHTFSSTLEEETEVQTAYRKVDLPENPVAHFVTTFNIGDDLYDDSFSIDAQTGEFLGECGVGISETIGVGDPKKVTAFEVWLFDKNDIQTVTKVLMSAHAINDSAITQRLASKGEPILMEPGKQILLETATLQLEARIVEMNYGRGALPEGSYVEKLTLELSVWPKA